LFNQNIPVSTKDLLPTLIPSIFSFERFDGTLENSDQKRNRQTIVRHRNARLLAVHLTAGNFAVGFYLGIQDDEPPTIAQPTIAQLEEAVAEGINQQFRDRTGLAQEIAQAVETAHVSVKVSGGRVLRCRLEGTEENLVANLLVDVSWDGNIHKGGHTKVYISFDADRVREFEIVETDALVNTQDPDFWRGVFELGGAILFGQ
jgi:hypothetical protein